MIPVDIWPHWHGTQGVEQGPRSLKIEPSHTHGRVPNRTGMKRLSVCTTHRPRHIGQTRHCLKRTRNSSRREPLGIILKVATRAARVANPHALAPTTLSVIHNISICPSKPSLTASQHPFCSAFSLSRLVVDSFIFRR